YGFVENNPVRFVDPFGLLKEAAAGGELEWTVNIPDKKGSRIEATFKFIPEKGCCCDTITFVQVVLERKLGANIVYPGAGEFGDKDYYSKFILNGARVDFIKGENDPYYGAENKKGKWQSERKGWTLGTCDTAGKGAAKADAYIT